MRARDSERDLLLLVARAASPQRDVALTETLRCPLDWERLLDLSYLHGCVQILAAAMSAPHRREAVPAPIARDLTALNAALSLRRHLQLRALTQVLDVLAAQSIQPVLLKGLALAASLYPDPELRPCQDLDLLVRSPAEARAAGVAFRQLGYVRCEPEPKEVPGFHTVYAAPAQSLTVELHTDPLQLGLPMRTASAVWRTWETVEITGRQVCVLGLEYQILHLCVHLHTHGYGRLIWLKDLDLLLRTRGAGADWGRIWALAATEGVTISVRHALAVVSALLDTPLPTRAPRRRIRDIPGEVAHEMLWPPHQVLALHGKQRLRSVRFNPHLGLMGVLPNLMVMGRRRDKLHAWLWPEIDASAIAMEHAVESISGM